MMAEGHDQGGCHFTCPNWKLLEANVAAMNMHEGPTVGTHLHMAVMMMMIKLIIVMMIF